MSNGTVLVLTTHPVIGAFLGMLVELTGCRPVFPDAGEEPGDAILRLWPALVLLDCDHDAARGDEAFQLAAAIGGVVLLFSSRRRQVEADSLAVQHEVKAFVLPIEYRAFHDLLSGTLATSRAG
ncbi:MAG: hypothetical protein M3336_00585 [Chloroflexota bacterium]|nr:hypothetical protein [Chloroflexota bacterium]